MALGVGIAHCAGLQWIYGMPSRSFNEAKAGGADRDRTAVVKLMLEIASLTQ